MWLGFKAVILGYSIKNEKNEKNDLTSKKNIYINATDFRWSHRLMVRTSPFHGGNMGSSPVGITNLERGCIF